jgi:hypothetical protein
MRRIISVTCLSAGLILLVFLLASTKQPTLAALGQGFAPDRFSLIQVVSPTPTQTGTLTPTFTVTPTLTSTVTPGLPAYPGITPTSPSVVQPTVITGSETPTSEISIATQVQVSGTVSPTVTLIPFPTVSMVFPTGIPSATIARDNPQENGAGTGSLRLWLVVGLLILWSAIIAWFWLVQRRA